MPSIFHFRIIGKTESGRFDDFLRSTPNGHILQAYCWGEAKKPGWKPIRVIGENRTGQIVAAATILKRQIPLLRRCFFYLPRGPVPVDWGDTDLFFALIDFLKRLAKKHRAIFIKIDPCVMEKDRKTAGLLEDAGFTSAAGDYEFGGLQPRFTFRLNIEQDPDSLLNSFKHKVRYKINYAYKQGLEFDRPGLEGLDPFMRMLTLVSMRNNFVIRARAYYEKVYQSLEPEKAAAIILGRFRGDVIAASMTLTFGDKAWNMYSGHSDEHRNIYVNQALIWEQINWAQKQGARWFDFCGVPGRVEREHPLYGIYHFKKSFGGEFISFVGEKDLVISRLYYFFWNRLFPLYRKILLKRAGLPAATGPGQRPGKTGNC